MNNHFYVTTPIYYVNDKAHIGHAYSTIIADALSLYYKLQGKTTFFLTGTDEHGQKIEQAARAKDKAAKAYVDEISQGFSQLWQDLKIQHDQFIRTTDFKHHKAVQKAFAKMFAKGDIYKGQYEGHYCVACESYVTLNQLIEQELCPECGRKTEILANESYFFRLSKYKEKLLEHYKQNPDFVKPKSRFNEMINLINEDIGDLSITRTNFNWGIKVPSELDSENHIIYVWLDALMNYLSALDYGENDEFKSDFWPANIHIIGKDILRFHAMYWPAFLLSLDLPLPKTIAAHGWWTRDGQKMSKSKGNVVDPVQVCQAYGINNFRYFILREIPFGLDGDFNQKAFISRINNDLNNDLGNLLNRLIGMSYKYFDGQIQALDKSYFSQEKASYEALLNGLDAHMQDIAFHKYLEDIFKIISLANKTIEEQKPWVKIKTGETEAVQALLAFIANILAKVALVLYPVMPDIAVKIAETLSFTIDATSFAKLIKNQDILPAFQIKKIEALFQKFEEPLLKSADQKATEMINADNAIDIKDFQKVQLKIGTVIKAQELENSKKLLKLEVDLGEARPRQVIAGIKEHYKAESLVNTQVVVVANLKPAKIMGHLSEGMVLAAKDQDGLSLIRTDAIKAKGAEVS